MSSSHGLIKLQKDGVCMGMSIMVREKGWDSNRSYVQILSKKNV